MGSAQFAYVTEADYLSGEELSGPRHEYVDGQIFVMAGATKTHGTIAGNIFFALRAQLRGTPCRAWVADMKATWRQRVPTIIRTWWPPVPTRICALIRHRVLSPPQN